MSTQQRFEGPTLASVLGRVQQELGAQAKIVSAQKIRSGGVGGFFQKERYEVLVDIDVTAANSAGDNAASPVTSAAPAPVATSPSNAVVPSSLLDLADAVNETESASSRPSAEYVAPSVSTETDRFAEILSRVAFQADLKSDNSASNPVHPPIIPGRPVEINDAAPAPVRTRITDSPLAKLGLPSQYIPAHADSARLNRALVNALAALPKSPEVRPTRGSIIAVVGQRQEALELASNLCEKWDQPTENIVMASQSIKGKAKADIVTSVRAAEDSRRSWSRRKKATIVAIEAEPGSMDVSWAEHMLMAFEPIATYGIADATRKSEDITDWAQALGGVDSLAVINIGKTQSPASVLETGIPVDRIDGHKATPAYWAMLLMDRLNA